MQERKTIKVNDEEISYFLSENAIHIDHNDALKRAVLNPQASTQIAGKILEDHRQPYDYTLSISPVSLAAEIYGHVFPEKSGRGNKEDSYAR